jgi:hypothetical protein
VRLRQCCQPTQFSPSPRRLLPSPTNDCRAISVTANVAGSTAGVEVREHGVRRPIQFVIHVTTPPWPLQAGPHRGGGPPPAADALNPKFRQNGSGRREQRMSALLSCLTTSSASLLYGIAHIDQRCQVPATANVDDRLSALSWLDMRGLKLSPANG